LDLAGEILVEVLQKEEGPAVNKVVSLAYSTLRVRAPVIAVLVLKKFDDFLRQCHRKSCRRGHWQAA